MAARPPNRRWIPIVILAAPFVFVAGMIVYKSVLNGGAIGAPCRTDDDCHGLAGVHCVERPSPGFCSRECTQDSDCKQDGWRCGSVEWSSKRLGETTYRTVRMCVRR